MDLRRIVEKSDTKAGKAFDLSIQALIIFSLITFSVSTLEGLSEPMLAFLYVSQLITVLLFTAEYLLRIYVAENKRAYLFSFYGLIDLIAILPFFLLTSVDLRAVRVVRLLQLFRILKIVRYSRALMRYHMAFKKIKEELVIFFSATCFLIYLSAVGIYYFEHSAQPEAFSSIFHSLWWAVATLTTVGYGDAFPITTGGRIFTFFILMIGLAIIAVPSGLLASALQRAGKEIADESELPG
ncbi:MAG: ion transporter [Candidatus Cyclonatronum sp.]|uniref:ion transporter n=1 Tax=Cyclonatronum sp. TaxID=3024185 RepID=UPI0025C48915|nr:ion transporter [Cyclonatronum sp.]MCC5933304.1 ion transporter [Balneolales bacterium]MCH8486839.1 ion transporter [Cyclonatronum sp.]